MPNDQLNVVIADGSTRGLRDRDNGSARQIQAVDVAPMMPTVVAGGQYNQACVSVFVQTVPATATHCLVSIDGGNVRYREDAGNPTSTAGIMLLDGFVGELPIPNALRFLQVSGTAFVNQTYRKYV